MYKSMIVTGLLALGLLGTPAAAFAKGLPAEPAGFTLDVALATAMRSNPDIQAAEAKLRQAKLEKESQDLWWARTIRANANYNVLGSQYGGAAITTDGMVLPTAAVGVGLNLGELLAGPKNSQRAAETVVIAEAELRKTTLNVASSVTAAYQEYLSAKEVAAMGDYMMEAAETEVKYVERQFAKGAAAANGVVSARLAVARVKADRVTMSGNVAKSWSSLLNLMGASDWMPATNTQKGN
jgi:outer membrane protein TolC